MYKDNVVILIFCGAEGGRDKVYDFSLPDEFVVDRKSKLSSTRAARSASATEMNRRYLERIDRGIRPKKVSDVPRSPKTYAFTIYYNYFYYL